MTTPTAPATAASASSAGGSRLARLAARAREPMAGIGIELPAGAATVASPVPLRSDTAAAGAEGAACELCGTPLGEVHRHLLEVEGGSLVCTCKPCSLLFDGTTRAEQRYRLVPERRERLADLQLSDHLWAQLRVPVELAFFFFRSRAGRVLAFYPGPMGATESLLTLEAWQQIESANPALSKLEPDVEALLVNRTAHVPGAWLVGLDRCYELVGLIRTRWKGFGGGAEVWREIERFFEDLDRRAPRDRSEMTQWAT